ncbi:MAG: glycosyltransferase [Hyphomicrobiaceae bacterium]|nr:glycosyltransferase [Hyphomicrobiaceae bacterium]
MKIALVHYWLVGMRGGESVIEALCEMFPDADIFTHVVDRDAISPTLRRHRIKTSFIGRLPRARRAYKSYLPLMPLALEQLDMRGYDLIISSESGPAKGIIPPPEAVHICYCHSPMRYIWNMYPDYRDGAGPVTRMAMPAFAHYLRAWDVSSAARVDRFVANSSCVAARIRKYYRRDAAVVHPPVSIDNFMPLLHDAAGDFHLMVGALVRYKRPDLAVQAFNAAARRLVVIGGGEMLDELRRMAGPTVEVLGPQPLEALRYFYARCRALVFPGEEDFGIVPVEAMASGRPVVAYGRGGALETVIDGMTGALFHEQTVEALLDAVHRCERQKFDPSALRRHASRFDRRRFQRQMRVLIDAELTANAARLQPRDAAGMRPRMMEDASASAAATAAE